MSKPEETLPSIAMTWSIVTTLYSILKFIKSMGKTVINWFSYQNEGFPENESGEIMRRIMIPESSLDKISSGWVALPFLNKARYMIGTILVSGLAGIIIGAPTLIMLSVGFFSLFIHQQLVSHEQARFDKARLIAEESIALSDSLKTLKAQYEKGVAQTTVVVKEIELIRDNMEHQATIIHQESKKITNENDTVVIAINATDSATKTLSHVCEQSAQVTDGLHEIQGTCAPYRHAVVNATEQLTLTTKSMMAASMSVQALQDSQQELLQATHRFSLFVDRHISNSSRPKTENHDSEDDDDAFLTALREQNNEDEAYMKQWGKRMPLMGYA